MKLIKDFYGKLNLLKIIVMIILIKNYYNKKNDENLYLVIINEIIYFINYFIICKLWY